MATDDIHQTINSALRRLNELCPAVEHFAKFGGDVPAYVSHGKLMSWYQMLQVAKSHIENALRIAEPKLAEGWQGEAELIYEAVVDECRWLAQSPDSCGRQKPAEEAIVPMQLPCERAE